jgi:hypothetical protein
MTVDALDPAAVAAMNDYRVYRNSLEREALEMRKSQRPLHAKRAEFNARIGARARWAEEFDPEPK